MKVKGLKLNCMGMQLRQLVQQAKEQLTGIYDAREALNIIYLALEDKFAFTRNDINSDIELSPEDVLEWEAINARLQKQEPIQYIIGEADFYGLRIKVNPSVLIPRPETEELVQQCILLLKHRDGAKVLDIGTGSGCIAITLKKELPKAIITALDISAGALATAQQTAGAYRLSINFKQINILDSKLWDKLPKYDLIVSNPPYIATTEAADMTAQVLKYEPHLALFAEGDDTLIFYRTIAELGKTHLNNGGCIMLEMNAGLSKEIVDIYRIAGYNNIEVLKDMQGRNRILKAFSISQ